MKLRIARITLIIRHCASSILSLIRDRQEFIFVYQQEGLSRARAVRRYLLVLLKTPISSVEFLNRRDEEQRTYEGAEAFRKISRAHDFEPFSWSGEATIVFPDWELRGVSTLHCDGLTVSGTHTFNWSFQTNSVIPITFPQPGRILGPSRYGAIEIANPRISVHRVTGVLEPFMPGSNTKTFSAERLTRQISNEPERIHRYLYRGVLVKTWGVGTEHAIFHDDGTYTAGGSLDAFDTTIFGRRARLRQVLDDKADQRQQVISVVIEGDDLDDGSSNALWLTLSLVAGARAQPYAVEHYDESGRLVRVEYLGTADFGPPASHPPFGLRLRDVQFDATVFTVLCDGILRLTQTGFPIAIALHHLFDSNTSYTAIQMRNLLFCIHTLFEAWADHENVRNIVGDKQHKIMRRQLKVPTADVFGSNDELVEAVNAATRNANKRTGAILQELFFARLGRELDEADRGALRRRNSLFHSGYVRPRRGQDEHEFFQEIVDDVGYLRTLAHEAILILAGYNQEIYDYGRWRARRVSVPSIPPLSGP